MEHIEHKNHYLIKLFRYQKDLLVRMIESTRNYFVLCGQPF